MNRNDIAQIFSLISIFGAVGVFGYFIGLSVDTIFESKPHCWIPETTFENLTATIKVICD